MIVTLEQVLKQAIAEALAPGNELPMSLIITRALHKHFGNVEALPELLASSRSVLRNLICASQSRNFNAPRLQNAILHAEKVKRS